MGSLKEICYELKQEGRITGVTDLDVTAINEDSLKGVASEDMAVLLLNHAVSQKKTTIEDELLKLKQRQPGIKIAEIIIDNLTYEIEFVAFPADLKLIRSCTDMDGVWRQIGENLMDMFPKPEIIIDVRKDQLKGVEQNSSKEPRTRYIRSKKADKLKVIN